MSCNTLELFIDNNVDNPIYFKPKIIVNAGYTGRNQEEVMKHVEELKKIGVPAPDEIPAFFLKSGSKLTTRNCCEVVDKDNTGEAEYVLLIAKDQIYVAAGSDHTDRKLEALDQIPKAKQVTPNFMSRGVWRYEDVKDHWDEIKLTAWIGKNKQTLYQQATLSAIMDPEELMKRVEKLLGGKLEEGTVIYSGTVGALVEGMPFSEQFHVELKDEKRNQSLHCQYEIKVLDWK
ncbi:MAG: DUF2848 family protein [Firmicutes bacterium]|nr:DUF2848 family protein [Bacillota bacterium]